MANRKQANQEAQMREDDMLSPEEFQQHMHHIMSHVSDEELEHFMHKAIEEKLEAVVALKNLFDHKQYEAAWQLMINNSHLHEWVLGIVHRATDQAITNFGLDPNTVSDIEWRDMDRDQDIDARDMRLQVEQMRGMNKDTMENC